MYRSYQSTTARSLLRGRIQNRHGGGVSDRRSHRDADWYEHRMFKGPDIDINLHVFSSGCPEIERMLVFRNWLRRNAADRDLTHAPS